MAKIKICGLFREEDIYAVNEALPDYAGFIVEYPKSRRNVNVNQLRNLREKLRKEIRAVGVFVNAEPNLIIDLCSEGVLDIVQLHGDEDNEYVAMIKEKAKKPVIKAYIIRDESDIEKANQSNADLVLLDGGKGEGKPFRYELLSGLRRQFALAGGLTVENIAEIAEKTGAAIVDISSGVETDGLKDAEKIMRAVKAIRKRGEGK